MSENLRCERRFLQLPSLDHKVIHYCLHTTALNAMSKIAKPDQRIWNISNDRNISITVDLRSNADRSAPEQPPTEYCEVTGARYNRPKGLSFGNEYGLYNDIDEHASTDVESLLSPATSSGTMKNFNSSHNSSTENTSTPYTVICKLDDRNSPMAVRSFDKCRKFSYGTSACTSIDGMRIVQDERGEEAEYKVKMTIDGKEFISWKRYNDFAALGNACVEFTDNGKHCNRALKLIQTTTSWNAVERHRPWLFKNLQITFLIEESILLDAFVKNFLFETPGVDMLLEFMQ